MRHSTGQLPRKGRVRGPGSPDHAPSGRAPGPDEGGFTLVELMVVVLIVGILIAMAGATFFEVRNVAWNRSAQEHARNGLTAERTYYSDRAVYTDLVADLIATEPSLTYVTAEGALTTGKIVYVKKYTVANPDDTVVVGSRSSAGKCYWLRDSSANPPGTQYLSNSTCTAPDQTTVMFASW